MRYIFTPGQTILAKNCRKTMENGKFYGRPFTDLVDKRQDGQHWETNFYPRLLIKTEYSSPREKFLWTQYWGHILNL